MKREKSLETALVLSAAFVIIFMITTNVIFLYFSLAFSFFGIFVKPVSNYIGIAWFKLAEILNYFFSRIIFGTIFFGFVLPVSLLYRTIVGDKLHLKMNKNSTWFVRNEKYSDKRLENIW